MTAAELPQLSREQVKKMAKDPGALDQARRDGQLQELLAGRDPGTCPTCGRGNTDPPA